jgi:starvation-inducible DNA-binding protein
MENSMLQTTPNRSSQSMNPTKNDLSLDVREQLCGLMNDRLADLIDLVTHAKQAHWNVKGPHFIALHELFDDLYGVLADHVDSLAERIVMLGGFANGTVQAVAPRTSLPAYPLGITGGRDHCDALSSSLAAFGKLVRDGIERADTAGDADTADLFTAISRDIDKYLWFVEAHLQD